MDFREELEKAKEELGVEEFGKNEGKEEKIVDVATVTIDGEERTIDFTNLTGREIVDIKARYRKVFKKEATLVEELDDNFYIMVASHLLGVSTKKLLDLKYKEFNKIKTVTRDFLSQD